MAAEIPPTKKDRVTVLITVEAIIAGFMITYGSLNGQMLIYWSILKNGGSPVTTYLSGVWIQLVVITSLTSILLLHASLSSNSMKDPRYTWGSFLFNVAIIMTFLFVATNALSIYHFTVTNSTYNIAPSPAAQWMLLVFIVAVGGLFCIWAGATLWSRTTLRYP